MRVGVGAACLVEIASSSSAIIRSFALLDSFDKRPPY